MQVCNRGLRRGVVPIAASLALLAAGPPTSASGATTPLAQAGSTGSGAGQLTNPNSLGIDASGNLYVSDPGNVRIDEFDADGNFIRAFGFDVASPGGGTGLETCTTATGCIGGDQGTAAGQIGVPTSAAFDAAGNLYVLDSLSNRVNVFDVSAASVSFLRAFGADVALPPGDTDFEVCTTTCLAGNAAGDAGALFSPQELAIDAAGLLYVADKDNQRISVFDVSTPAAPTFARAFGSDVAFPSDASGFETCTTGTGCVIGDSGNLAGHLDNPVGLSVDAAGRLYVTESGDSTSSRRVSVFDVSTAVPAFIHAFGRDVMPLNGGTGFEVCTTGTGCIAGDADTSAGAFNVPSDAALDGAGNLYVTENANNRVSVIDVSTPASPAFENAFGFDVLPPDGTGVFEICTAGTGCLGGDSGAGVGQLAFPSDVAVDCRGAVWVVETVNSRLERFGEPGTAGCPIPATPPATANPTASGPTGQRAAALKKCKRKKTARAKRKCKKKANLLPL